MRGADLLVKTLSALGVGRMFTLSGNQIMPVFDAALDAGTDMVHFRHEAAAVHTADAWGRLTGEPGVALVTAGPGFANTLTALYVATAAESPVVLLSGHAPLSDLGRGGFQEMPQADMAGQVSKASWTASSPAGLGHDVARAFSIARSGRPGPVHVALPFDVLEASIPDDEAPPVGEASAIDTGPPTESDIDGILGALRSARRPVVLPGQAITRTGGKALAELSDRTGLPVVGMESPRGTNDPSLGAFVETLAEADLLVLLGKRLDYGLKFGESPALSPDCRIVHVDHEPSALEQTRKALEGSDRLAAAIHADPVSTAAALASVATPRADGAWLEEVQSALSYVPSDWAALESPGDGPLHPAAVCRAVQDLLGGEEPVFVLDGGEYGQWAQACVSSPRLIINGPGGSIGTSIPGAIAARLAFPDAPVVTMLGDGTFGFHGMELDTAVRHGIPFVAIVGNDAKWNAEYQIQLREYGPSRAQGCELLPSRYDLLAESLGAHGEQVTTGSELVPALRRALESGRPACVNVLIQPAPAPVVKRG